ncbi:MAG: diaminopimelate epimerase [Sphingopyxis sp.]
MIDARTDALPMPPARARAIADRHTGIGCDQLIMIEHSATADVRMRIWNADGMEVSACGNATRCVAHLLGGAASIETAGGTLKAFSNGGLISVDFPEPLFAYADIPLAYAMDTMAMPVGWDNVSDPMAVNVGNPHIVFFVADADAIDLERLGPMIEHDPLFPKAINVNIATVTSSNSIALRVWERGVGLTRACGTGAIATAICAIRSRRCVGPITVSLPGGDLLIDWPGRGPVTMHGPAQEIYRGTADWDNFG